MDNIEIQLPVIKLRDYQKPIWDRWFKERTRMMSLEWARRHGKDLFSLNIMIAEAMIDVGNYWHILPESQQIRNAIWEGVTADGQKYLDCIPEVLIHHVDNQSMKIYLRDPRYLSKAGSIISFVGGDRYDKRVGAGLKGAVISEFSLQKPNLYDLAVEPMLKETKGWVIFNYTPRGENHATKMHDWIATQPEYIASKITIADTRIVTEEDLRRERERGKPEEIIQQEYYCSREGSNFGSYYGDMLRQNKSKVGKYPHDPQYPVHTLWDLGISDQMAIWFIQLVQRELRIIDYYENSNYGLGHYASVLQGKGYLYAMHHLPHDGTKRQLTTAEMAVSVEQQLKNLGVRPIKIHERRMDLYGVIQKVRSIIPRCYFDDNENVMLGYEALKQYQREWDESRQIFKNTPLHNWASHSADAFSIIADVESVAHNRPSLAPKRYTAKVRI